MYYNDQTILFLDGEWLKASEAKADLFNQTLHYGSGVFEGIRSYKTAEDSVHIFKAEEHYERLLYSAKKMHIEMRYSVRELVEITYDLLKKNKLSDAYIRPLIYLGANMSLTASKEVHLLITAWQWDRLLGDRLLDIMVSSYQRPNPKSVPVDAKVTGHYANSILASTEARSKGFDEALLLDAKGFVAEGPGANFFFEKDGVLYTPPLGNILPGITRNTVMDLAGELEFPLEERFFTLDDLQDIDGAFFTGTAAEVAGIRSLNGKPFRKNWEDTKGYDLSLAYRNKVKNNIGHDFLLV
ncbi:branched-chain amino acid transaminase [Xanthovirga aplysinae]|uniref:branched-chain amino acid transaminase n=1 Tax=Xanthovirga aplysinae TaxID=2529853 RepID=UPI0012BC6B2A|nr:branched-chain amino acid transaminase [Xanthovirga aplysinae]MTI32515.1 branched-chain amino acid transaminase [Xanthovirga aplysinae]